MRRSHLKVDFNEFDYGFQYKRIRTDTSEHDRLWTVGRVCLWPNALFTGNHIEFRVPIDDENTLSDHLAFQPRAATSASLMSRTGSRPGTGRSPTPRPGAGSPATS